MRSWLLDDPLRHEIAVMIFEALAAVKLNGGVAVVHFQMYDRQAKFSCLLSEEVEYLRPDAKAPVSSADKEFIHPCSSAAVLQAIVKCHHDVADLQAIGVDEPYAPQRRIAQ